MFGSADGVVAAGGSPYNLIIAEGTAVRGVDWRVGEIFVQCWRVGVEIDHELRKVTWWRGELRDVEKVLGRNVDGSFVDSGGDIEHERIGRVGA